MADHYDFTLRTSHTFRGKPEWSGITETLRVSTRREHMNSYRLFSEDGSEAVVHARDISWPTYKEDITVLSTTYPEEVYEVLRYRGLTDVGRALRLTRFVGGREVAEGFWIEEDGGLIDVLARTLQTSR